MIQSRNVDGIRTITIDAPHRKNALTRAGLDELETAVGEASEPILYLKGAGDAFCAGADLETATQLDEETAEAFATQGQRVANTLESYDGIVVAGIDGPARGGGVELAAACDLRIATAEATFAQTGVTLGLFGAWGGTARLPEIVGEGVALDLSLTGRVINAEEAKQIGLVSQIREKPRSVAVSLLDSDRQTLTTIKELIRDRGAKTDQEQKEATAFAALASSRQGR